MRRLRWMLPFLLALVAAWPPGARADGEGSPELRVLFVGNSFTRFHQLPRLVARLARHDEGAPRVRTSLETRPGCTLRRHWIGRRAPMRIRRGGYTHVVLQGHSLRPIDRPEELATYAARFDQAIEGSGARTVLYATWARAEGSPFYRRREDLDTPETMQQRIDRVYDELAGRLEAELAPVGAAWLEATRRLDVQLHGRDGIHPTLAGTYLSACVLYATLTGRSPRDIDYAPYPLDPETARALRAVAADTFDAAR